MIAPPACDLKQSGKFWNQPWHDYTGIPPEGAQGFGCKAAINPGDLGRSMDALFQSVAGEQGGEVEAACGVTTELTDGFFSGLSHFAMRPARL
jgi:PAS domain-containing protein